MNWLKIQQRTLSWIILAVILLLAIWMRLRLSERPYLVAGTDGMYYPLQVRALIEHFRLALPDMPLLFLLEAAAAKIILLFSNLSTNESVLLSVRYMDAILPVLAGIPLFLIAQMLKSDKTKPGFIAYLLVVFCLLNFSTILMNSSGLHKNNFGIVLLLFFIYFCIKALRQPDRKTIVSAGAILILCALTHFGSFCVALLFLLLLLLRFPVYFKAGRKTFLRYTLFICITLCTLLLVVGLFDHNRFLRLLHIPLQVFISPTLLLMLRAGDIAADINPLNLITLTPLWIIALVLFITKRKQLEASDRLIASTLLILSFIMLIPLIGIEWYNRFLLMAYVPLAVLYLYILNLRFSPWLKALPVTGFLLMILMAFGFGFSTFREDLSISKNAYEDFKSIKNDLHFSDSAMVIARQDLRMLSGWEFKTKVSAAYLLKKEQFPLYDTIYLVRQIRENPIGRLRDELIPSSAESLFKSAYFEVFRLNKDSAWLSGVGKPPLLFGEVVSVGKDQLAIKNLKSGKIRSIHVTEETSRNITSGKAIRNGMVVEVWGTGRIFSLELDADLVNEIILK